MVSLKDSQDPVWRVIQGAGLVLVLGVFLYSLRSILNPFLLYGLLLVMLAPYRHVKGYAVVVTAATVLTLLWVMHTTGSLLAPFVLAFVLAYILDPAVDRVSAHRRVSRPAAIAIILVPVLLSVPLVLGLAIPALAGQVAGLIEDAPRLLQRAEEWIEGLGPNTLGFDVPFVDEAALLAQLRAIDSAAIVEFLQARQEELTSRAWGAVLGLGRGLGTLVTVIGYLVLTPVIMFYLLRDYDEIVVRAGELVPAKLRPQTGEFFSQYDDLLSRYLRGQVSVALIVGAITWIGLLIVGFPYSFLLGVLVAVLGVVPYVGLVVSLVPAIFIALVSGDVAVSLIKVGAVYGIAQILEGAVVSPRIVGESVGLHPVWIVLALSLGGFYFGFVGLLIGVPLAVGAKLLLVRLVERYRATALFREGSALSS